MANALYDLGREAFLGGDADWDADTIKVSLVDGDDYTENLATDEFYDDIPGGAIVSASGALGSKTKAAGVADAADVTLSAVTGDVSELLVLWQDTTVVGTSHLLVYIDSATNLPITPNGGDIEIQWDSGANRIFKL